MNGRHLLAAFALLAAPALASAQVYKCTDKNGRQQFVQTKPHDGSCAESATHAPQPNGGNVDDLMKFSKEIDKERKQEASVREKNEELEARRAARCSNDRGRLALLEQSSRVFTMDDKGERHYQDEAERQRLLDAAQAAVSRDCS